jgi:hypothetical protein
MGLAKTPRGIRSATAFRLYLLALHFCNLHAGSRVPSNTSRLILLPCCTKRQQQSFQQPCF